MKSFLPGTLVAALAGFVLAIAGCGGGGSASPAPTTIVQPYLAISGTADTTAPLAVTQQGIERLSGTRELVELVGVKRGLDAASINDIFTWSFTFLDAEVRGNPAAHRQLSTMSSVEGGGDDRVMIPYNGQVPH